MSKPSGPLSAMLFARFQGKMSFPDVSLAGRTVLITGANGGLGLETARHFATLSPSRLVLAVRRVAAGETAADEISKSTGLARSKIEVWELDLASFAGVKAFGTRAKEELERLDIACLNAAVAGFRWDQTADGWERMLQVNAIPTGLLSVELLPLLLETADLLAPAGVPALKPHLAIVASDVHFWTKFSELKAYKSGKASSILSALNDKKLYNSTDRYNVSTLLNVFLVRELAALPTVRGKVVVTTPNPAFTQSSLLREAPWPVASLFPLLARPTAESAKVLVYGSLVDTTTSDPEGAFIHHCKVIDPAPLVLSEGGREVSRKVMEEVKAVRTEVDEEAVRAVSYGREQGEEKDE
ncbi:hypothetical protein JCM8097_008918 [Rhodosporidiobolus ruineniae]